MHHRNRYVVTLEDEPNQHEGRPAMVRLQTLLKLMFKGYGLRCCGIRPEETVEHPEPHADERCVNDDEPSDNGRNFTMPPDG